MEVWAKNVDFIQIEIPSFYIEPCSYNVTAFPASSLVLLVPQIFPSLYTLLTIQRCKHKTYIKPPHRTREK